jgi:tRNA 5-methylaminomethyl-2-thiouridine biosynthesis bifunctional protein
MLHARYSEFAPLAAELQAGWPLLLPGLHRLHFEKGHVTLTLALGDIADILTKLRLAADAIYLDGFAPDRNPEMWANTIMRGLARLARPGTTAATYTTARKVRDALAAAGFVPELRTGFGRKRHMLAARFSPPRPPRHAPHPAPQWSERRAIVVGAGLAGAAVAERLAARGWAVELIERHASPAAEASGMPAGSFHPQVSRDDSILSRLTRAGFLYAIDRWRALETSGHRFAWAQCGLMQIARDAREDERMADSVRALGNPAAYVDYLARAEAGRRMGVAAHSGGLWFPAGGWVRSIELVAALLDAARPGLTFYPSRMVNALERDGNRWRALAADGTLIAAAPVVVLANSHDATRLVSHGVELKRVRGQLTCLPPGSIDPPAMVLAGAGLLIPATDGAAVVGSTYDFEDEDPEPHASGHAGNLERIELLLPGSTARLDPAQLGGTVGFRCVTPDRMPLIGRLPDAGPASANSASPSGKWAQELPRLSGLYGAFGYASRGLTWAALGGELIASMLEGEPLPLEGDLADAVDPARFLLRRARRGGS